MMVMVLQIPAPYNENFKLVLKIPTLVLGESFFEFQMLLTYRKATFALPTLALTSVWNPSSSMMVPRQVKLSTSSWAVLYFRILLFYFWLFKSISSKASSCLRLHMLLRIPGTDLYCKLPTMFDLALQSLVGVSYVGNLRYFILLTKISVLFYPTYWMLFHNQGSWRIVISYIQTVLQKWSTVSQSILTKANLFVTKLKVYWVFH